jgi:hypothetical protein
MVSILKRSLASAMAQRTAGRRAKIPAGFGRNV